MPLAGASMRKLLLAIVLPILLPTAFALANDTRSDGKDNRLFEMRTYYAHEGKLDALHARFRNHTVKLFEKHGMTNIGYWVPIENPERKLIYVLAFANAAAREQAWKAFLDDPDWKAAFKQSEVNGPLVAKSESVLLNATDYSPKIQPSQAKERVFELRTYTASPGNLEALHARFRNHTTKLFEKHGMTNIAYWSYGKDQKDADRMLIYLLAHPSVDAAKASFDAFRMDPDWLAARKASEEKAGGSLTAPDGVKSLFLKAVDYSQIR
jgi:hypothetical protein